MSINSLSNLTNGYSYIQSLIGSALGNSNSVNNSNSTSSNSWLSSTQDNNALSPFAQMLSSLQQLQQSNPTEYQTVTQQIATNLQSAAQTAQSDGNTNAANQLNQLATDFSSASSSGQLPNVQDLAQAVGGGHHHGGHHHHFDASSSSSNSSDSTSGSTSTSSTSSNNSLSITQLLGNLQDNNQFNPTSIILNTLSNAGVLENS